MISAPAARAKNSRDVAGMGNEAGTLNSESAPRGIFDLVVSCQQNDFAHPSDARRPAGRHGPPGGEPGGRSGGTAGTDRAPVQKGPIMFNWRVA
jgi:hypothetical protein